jgi:lipopolysaccharide transport system ATP-binding protein
MSDTVIRVENISKLYRLGEVGTGSLAHDVNRWWHKVRGKEDPYLKIGEVNDRTKPAKQASSKKSLTTEDTESTEGAAGVRLAGQAGAAFPNPSTSELASDSENTSLIRSANAPRSSEEQSDSKALDSRPSTLVSAPKAQSDWVYALKDVSFEVKRGEVLGIIGRNGAGKSTLLKILSRVTTQSSGQIKVKGRIASLLEVGTGFHPELTGRENIFLNGAILGMRKAEIARKFDEIVEFSGCARYIDTPVKRYSSGMYVRLAFAVAAHLEPEILIVDEVLAVGDAEFQKKCLGKMKDVAGHGRTILFVSHNMAAVANLCQKVLTMHNGTVHGYGDAQPIIEQYLQALSRNPVQSLQDIPRQGNRKGRFTGYTVSKKDGTSVEFVQTGQDIALVFACEFDESAIGHKLDIGFGIHGPMDERLFVHYASMGGQTFRVKDRRQIFRFDLPNLPLNPGCYTVFPRIEIDGEEADFPQLPVGEINVTEGDYYGTGKPTNNKGSCCLLIQGKWCEHGF